MLDGNVPLNPGEYEWVWFNIPLNT